MLRRTSFRRARQVETTKAERKRTPGMEHRDRGLHCRPLISMTCVDVDGQRKFGLGGSVT